MTTTFTSLIQHLRTLAARQANGDLPDRQLLETFLTQRSEDSFAALLQRHGPMVLSVCRRVLHHEQDAEDAFQAVFLVLARKAGSLRKHESVGSFLHGVAYRVARTLKDKSARRAAHEKQWQGRPPADPMEDIAWRELRSVLDEELRKLPEKYRAPLVLCYLEGKTQDEAARQLGWTRAVFRRRLEQGRDRFGGLLRRRGLTLSAALSAPLLFDSAATAALPPLLAASTVRAALALANGQPLAALTSASVAALAEGGGKSLLVSKATVALALLMSLMLGAGGLLAHRAMRTPTVAEAPAAPPRGERKRDAERRDERLEIHGVVQGPDGKPIKGAKVYGGYTKEGMKQQVVTGADGRYRFTLRRDNVDPKGYYADPWEWTPIAAVADGYGLDWKELFQRGKGNRLDLHLVKDDAPIEGCILDLEGRPVAGATVRILRLHATADKSLSTFLKQWTNNPRQALTGPWIFPAQNDPIQWRRLWHVSQTGLVPPVTTDKAGKFRLTGLGRERFIELLVSGPGIEQSELLVVTRKNVDVKALSKPSPEYLKRFAIDGKLPPLFSWPTLHGATFEHVAAPTKPIAGVVRDKTSGKPVAGIRIIGHSPLAKNGYFYRMDIETVTDEKGAYRLTGLPKDQKYSLLVGAPEGVNYLPLMKNLTDTAGLTPLKADLEMERGVLVEGRLLDKASGKPIAGEVYYAPLPSNPRITVKQRRVIHQFILGKHFAGKDGAFKFAAYPGPGIVSAVAATGNYLPMPFTPEEQKLVGIGTLSLSVAGNVTEIQKQAHRLIDPEAKTTSLKCDLIFQPAGR